MVQACDRWQPALIWVLETHTVYGQLGNAQLVRTQLLSCHQEGLWVQGCHTFRFSQLKTQLLLLFCEILPFFLS